MKRGPIFGPDARDLERHGRPVKDGSGLLMSRILAEHAPLAEHLKKNWSQRLPGCLRTGNLMDNNTEAMESDGIYNIEFQRSFRRGFAGIVVLN